MAQAFSYTFRQWLMEHDVFIPDFGIDRSGPAQQPRTIFGSSQDLDPAQRTDNKEFRPCRESDVQLLDAWRSRWFDTCLPALEYVHSVAADRAAAEEGQDRILDITRALNLGLEPEPATPAPTYRRREHHQTQLRALLIDLFQAHPPLLAAVIKMCELSITKQDYRQYVDEYRARLAQAANPPWAVVDPCQCPPHLLEDHAVEVLITHITPAHHIFHGNRMKVDYLYSCAPDGGYRSAQIFLPSSHAPLLQVDLSGGPRVQTAPGEGLFMPCNVMHSDLSYEHNMYGIAIQANTIYNSIENAWYFKPLAFTLEELRDVQAATARSLARVRQNVSLARVPAARPLFGGSERSERSDSEHSERSEHSYRV